MSDEIGYPVIPKQEISLSSMTLRDYFAIHADWEDVRHFSTDDNGFNIPRTKARYKYADSMLADRDK